MRDMENLGTPLFGAESTSPELNEEIIDGGLGVLVRNKTLYYGSDISGIEKLRPAREDTVGNGVYFTSDEQAAMGYARRRSHNREDRSSAVYEIAIENMKLLDLRKGENVKRILGGFKEILEQKLKEPELRWDQETVLQKAIEAINAGAVGAGNLRDVTFSTGQMFTDYVKSLGYDGLITLEGGGRR